MATASAIKAGQAFIEISEKGLTATQAKLKAFSDTFDKLGKKINDTGASLMKFGAGTLAPLAAGLKIFEDMGSELTSLSKKTGLSVESLSEIGYAARQNGVDMAKFGEGWNAFTSKLTEAAIKGGENADIFARMGVNIQKLRAMSPEQRFNAIADALSKFQGQDQIFLAEKLGIKELLPLLKNGSSGINDLRTKARQLGQTISTEDATAGAKFSKAMGDVWQSLKLVGFQVGATVAGVRSQWIPTVLESLKNARDWVKENEGLIVSIGQIGVGLTVAGAALVGMGQSLKVVSAAFSGIAGVFGVAKLGIAGLAKVLGIAGGALSFLLSPIGLVAAAVVGVGVYFAKTTGLIDTAISKLSGLWEILSSDFGEAWDTIVNAISSGNVLGALSAIWDLIRKEWGRVVNSLSESFDITPLVNSLTAIKDAGVSAWNWISSTAINTYSTITTTAETFWTWLTEQITANEEVWGQWGQYLSDIWGNLADTAQAVWDGIKSGFDTLVSWIDTAWVSLFGDSFKNAAGGAFTWITNQITALLDMFSLMTTNWKLTWDYMKAISKGSFYAAIDYASWWAADTKNLFDSTVAGIAAALNELLGGLGDVFSTVMKFQIDQVTGMMKLLGAAGMLVGVVVEKAIDKLKSVATSPETQSAIDATKSKLSKMNDAYSRAFNEERSKATKFKYGENATNAFNEATGIKQQMVDERDKVRTDRQSEEYANQFADEMEAASNANNKLAEASDGAAQSCKDFADAMETESQATQDRIDEDNEFDQIWEDFYKPMLYGLNEEDANENGLGAKLAGTASSQGTFSAWAVRGLGQGSAAERTAKAVESIDRKTRENKWSVTGPEFS